MPFLDYNNPDTWKLLYDLDAEPYEITGTRPHVRLGYHRAVLFNTLFKNRADTLPGLLGWTTATRIAVIGCGFGWFVEQLQARGFTNVIGCDISTYVQTNKSLTESSDIDTAIAAVGLAATTGDGLAVKNKLFDGGNRARVSILNQDGSTVTSRNAIKSALGNKIDVIFTEDVVPSLTDSEVTAAATQLRKLAPCVHLITCAGPGNTPGLCNWKSLSEWKAILTPDICINSSTYQVL
jgi:SAM-dependent methyltransferase